MNQIEKKLLYPQPGSRIEAAREFGIDLTIIIERLRLTPEQRVRDLQAAIRGLEAVHGKARQRAPTAARFNPDSHKERA